MSSKKHGDVIPLTRIVPTLGTTGAADSSSTLFPDQTLIDLLVLALDFHFDENENELLEEMYRIMGEAEDRGVKKVDALKNWLETLLEPIADEIEEALVACG